MHCYPRFPIAAALAAVLLISPGLVLKVDAGVFYTIILTGGKSKEEAQKGVDRFRKLDYSFVKPAEGFPAVRASDGIKGLKPGFMISLLGFCSDEGTAVRLKDLMSLDFKGAYIRKVEGDFKGLCPKIIPAEKDLAEDNAKVQTWPLKTGMPGISWKICYIPEEGEGGCAPSTIHMRVEQNGLALAETIFSEECTPKSDETDDETGEPLSYGSETKFTLTPVTFGDRSFVDVVVFETGDFDDVLVARSLWGFLCGRLIEIPYGANSYTAADGEDEIGTAARGDSGWKHLVISGTNEGRESFERKLDWDEGNCQFVEAGSK